MTKQEVQNFRTDFDQAVRTLEGKYGVTIDLGTIRYDANELRAKMTARKGERGEVFTKDDFKVGDTVKINHPKVDPNNQYRVIKVMTKNIKVEKINGVGIVRVSPSFLVKL